MNKIIKALGKIYNAAPDIIMILGIACISYGAFIIWFPAGFITLGILLCIFAWLWARGEST